MELACRTLFRSPTIEMPNSYLKILENMPKICQQQDKSDWNRKFCCIWPPVVGIPPFPTHMYIYIYNICMYVYVCMLHIILCSCKFIASECNAHCDSPALAWGENKRHSKFENCSDCDWTATVFFWLHFDVASIRSVALQDSKTKEASREARTDKNGRKRKNLKRK